VIKQKVSKKTSISQFTKTHKVGLENVTSVCFNYF